MEELLKRIPKGGKGLGPGVGAIVGAGALIYGVANSLYTG